MATTQSLSMAPTAAPEIPILADDKDTQEMIETEKDRNGVSTAGDARGPTTTLVSNYASLTRPQIIRKFFRTFVIGVAVASAGIYAGYTTSMTGSIVGNKGKWHHLLPTT